MALGRRRAAVTAGALVALSLPFTAGAVAPPLTCGPKLTGTWEQIPVRPFQPVSGLPSQDAVSAYAVDVRMPYQIAVTNGVRVQLTSSDGCEWDNGFALASTPSTDQPFAGSASSIVSVGMLQGTTLVAVQEGTGSASRPHVVRSFQGGWQVSDSGLPPAGAPRLLRTGADAHTAYLTVSPTATGGTDNGGTGSLPTLPTLPQLPVGGSSGGPTSTPTGLLYATTDAGATWSLRTGASSLPSGGAGFTALEVDTSNPSWIYGIIGGSLVYSHDGGQTFTTEPGSGWTAITVMFSGAFAAFDGQGHGVFSYNGGKDLLPFKAPTGITSAAYRLGDTTLMVESHGVVRSVQPFTGFSALSPTPATPRTGSLRGDDGVQSTFHAIAGHSLLRYVDKIRSAVGRPPVAIGDTTVAPPLPGTIAPAVRDVSLLMGQSRTEDFTLSLPKNPTPLDLFFLVDVSTSMSSYIDNLKANIHKVVDRLTAAKIDLRVGVGTLGTAPAAGEAPYPDAYVTPPTVNPQTGQTTPGPPYRKPRIYELIRRIGKPDASLNAAINSIQLETDPQPGPSAGTYHEGQLLALEQMVTGSGVKTEQDVQSGLPTYSAVAPGQDAHFRGNPDIRRMVVIASDEAFDAPYGTPTKPGSTTANPILDFTRTLRILNGAHVGVFGITAGSQDSIPDMQTLARGTHTFTPKGGVSCGGDPEQKLKAGDPLVCSQEGDFSAIIGRVLSQLSDHQNVTLQPRNSTPVLTALDGQHLLGLDVKQPNTVHFSATVSCRNISPGTYAQDVDAVLRGYTVGTTRLYVNCIAPQAAVPPVPLQIPAHPPVQPAVQPPVPVPAPPPAAQPQPQPNPNVNPLTAGVTQEQKELQVAVALNDLGQAEPEPAGEQLAMVDRRKREAVQAFGLLSFAMAACAGLGLARLRTRTQPRVRMAR